MCSNDVPRLTVDFFYGKVKFVFPHFCVGKMLKNVFLKMYLRLIAVIYNVVNPFSYITKSKFCSP